MTDPRIIPLLDPEPTEDEMEGAKVLQSFLRHDAWSEYLAGVAKEAHARADHRVRIARQAIEWAIGMLDDNDSRWLKHCLFTHDAAIKEMEGNRD